MNTTWNHGAAFTYVRTAQDEIDARFGARGYDRREYLGFNRALAEAYEAKDFEAVKRAVGDWTAKVEDRCRKAGAS